MELHGEEKDQWSHVVHRLLHRPVPLPTSATAAAGVRPRKSDDAEIIVGSTIIKNQNNKANDHHHQYITASTNSSHDIIANKESPLENLPPDTASHILTYLHPHDLFHLALLSKKGNVMFNNDLVWKWKFRDRWNCIPDKLHKVNIRMHGRGSTSDDPQKCRTSNNVNAKKCNKQKQTNRQRNGNGFWKQCYINAHCNPHDLWIRHWNCVSPEDVTTCVGRTAIPEIEFEDGGDNVEEESGWEKEWLRVREQLLRKRREDAMSVEQGEIMNDQERERIHKFRQDFDSPSLRLCPTCRYHPMLHPRGYEDVLRAVHDEVEFAKRVSSFSKVSPDIHNDVQLATTPDPVETTEVVAAAHALLSNSCNESNWYMEDNSVESTPARAIHYSTQYSIAKWCRNLRVGYARNDDEGTIKTEINNRNNSLLGGYCDLLSERIQWGNEMDCASSNDVDLSNDSSQGSSKRTRSHNTNSNPIQIKAQFAFKCASTYNRKIEPTQFNSSGVNFLTDALFFNIHASYEKDRTAIPSLRKRLRSNSGTETASPAGPSSCNETLPENKSRNYSPLDELLLDLQRMGQPEKSSSNALSGLGPNFETSHHSWHIIRLTNPEYILPITFRAYIQCPEIFTVYPSEGYLKPGETIHLVLGVRMKGSLMNEAFENIDVEREEVCCHLFPNHVVSFLTSALTS